jgi:amino acid permease
VLDWAARVVPSVLFLFIIASYAYDYSKNRAYRKSHSSENISPNLRVWGTIFGVTGGVILTISYFLTLFAFPKLSITPFYLGIVGMLVFLVGWGIYIKWRKSNKLSPFVE